MKNKKLFAILTLVCFMFTLMPVAAFAADVTAVEAPEVAGITAAGLSFEPAGEKGWIVKVAADGTVEKKGAAKDNTPVEDDVYTIVKDANVGDDVVGMTADNTYVVTEKDVELYEAALEAANAYDGSTVAEKQSYAWTAEAEATIKAGTSEAAEVKLQVWNRYSMPIDADTLYVWATAVDSNIPVESLNVYVQY